MTADDHRSTDQVRNRRIGLRPRTTPGFVSWITGFRLARPVVDALFGTGNSFASAIEKDTEKRFNCWPLQQYRKGQRRCLPGYASATSKIGRTHLTSGLRQSPSS